MTSLRRLSLLQRVRTIFAGTLIALAASDALPSGAKEPGHQAIGGWKFTSVLDSTQITSLDEQDASQLLGHVMAIRKDGARFGDYKCQPPNFETKSVEPNLYLQEQAGIDNSKIRLPNPVTVIDISCTQILIKKPDRAVIFWDGFFFEAVKVTR